MNFVPIHVIPGTLDEPENIRPALVVGLPLRDASAFSLLEKQAAQAATEPAVFLREDVRVAAVLEVLEPTF